MREARKSKRAAASDQNGQAMEERLARVFRRNALDPKGADTHDFVFHMLDWQDDAVQWAEACRDPAGVSDSALKQAVDGILLHAAGHIVAAAELYGGFIDSFDVLAQRSRSKRHAAKATPRRKKRSE